MIFQHPLEAKHAKSTVPLLRLSLPDIQLEVAEQLASPPPLEHGLWWLLYPDADALDLDAPHFFIPSLCAPDIATSDLATPNLDAADLIRTSEPVLNAVQAKKQIGGLIVLDGTWRKTRLLLHLNPWLKELPKLTFSQAPASIYAIRKGPGGQALSTLESVCHVLNRLYPEFATAPLHALLAARVAQFQVQGAATAKVK